MQLPTIPTSEALCEGTSDCGDPFSVHETGSGGEGSSQQAQGEADSISLPCFDDGSHVLSPRAGGYAMPSYFQNDIGPVDELERLLDPDKSSMLSPCQSPSVDDAALRSLVFQFPEGIPHRLRGAAWKVLLRVDKKRNAGQTNALNQFLTEMNLDEPNQRVIRSDVERTRAHLEMFRDPQMRSEMEGLLTFYCKMKSLKYKQGLNEVIAPVLTLKSPKFTLSEVYNCFYAFVNRYLPVFWDDEFTSLQCTFIFFKHLLLYHDPGLHTLLEYHGVSPELYVTPWFLTAFASKTQIDHLLCLWDYYASEDDRFFFCFIGLALLVLNRDTIFQTDVSQLPETLTRITIRSYRDLRRVWFAAKEFKASTPASFAWRMSISQKDREMQPTSLRRLEHEKAFLMMPYEILRHAYSLVVGGSPVSTPWKLLLIDLRPRWQFNAGRLPPAIHVDYEGGNWRSELARLTGAKDPLLPIKSNGDSPRPISVGDSERCRADVQPLNIVRSPGLETAGGEEGDQPAGASPQQPEISGYSRHNKQTHHICLLGADDQDLRNVLEVYQTATQDLSLKWVSVAAGGFHECHRLAIDAQMELVDHQPLYCRVCSPDYRYVPDVKTEAGGKGARQKRAQPGLDRAGMAKKATDISRTPKAAPRPVDVHGSDAKAEKSAASSLPHYGESPAATSPGKGSSASGWLDMVVRRRVAGQTPRGSNGEEALNSVSNPGAKEAIQSVRSIRMDDPILQKLSFTELMLKPGISRFVCWINALRIPHMSSLPPPPYTGENLLAGTLPLVDAIARGKLTATSGGLEGSRIVPDTNRCYLLITPQRLALVSQPRPLAVYSGCDPEEVPSTATSASTDLTCVYANYPLVELVKITSKRMNNRVLCFYFSSNKDRAQMRLLFPSAEEAHKCISTVKGTYRRIRGKSCQSEKTKA